MSFFTGSGSFEINGGSFYNVQGNQVNSNPDAMGESHREGARGGTRGAASNANPGA
jgi:hypothetical protein